MFESSGYDICFVQKDVVRDSSEHLFSLIYTFYSPKTKLKYVLKSEYYVLNVFAVKFYAKKDKRSNNKYSKTTNKGDVSNILLTCLKIIPLLLKEFPGSSFCFIGSPSIDNKSKRIEGYTTNQRFRIYSHFVSQVVGVSTFTHYEYEKISAYSLINQANKDVDCYEKKTREMFFEVYPDLINV